MKTTDLKNKVNFGIYDFTAWFTNNCNTEITEVKAIRLIEYNMRNIFLEKSYTENGGETVPRPFSDKSKLSIHLDQ